MGFVRFFNRRRNSGGITLRANGNISLSSELIKSHKLESMKFVSLLWDESTKQVGLEFSRERQAGAAKIVSRERQRFLCAKTFMQSNQIPPGQYTVTLDLALGFFVASRSA